MNDLIKINYETEQPTVSARDLHRALEVETKFKDWFPRMTEYGFEEGKDFSSFLSKSNGGRPSKEYEITVDMAKELCMIQRSEKGKQFRKYFIEVEKAWNDPVLIMGRALELQKKKNANLLVDVERMKPKEIFADAVATSKQSILIGELAKLLKQNGVDTGEKRLFSYLRDNGYLIRRKGTDYNAPTQRSMEIGLFEVKETAITHSDGHTTINKTTKVTGKGQQYFINKFLAG